MRRAEAGTKPKRPFGGEPRYAPPGVSGSFGAWAAAAEAMADGFTLGVDSEAFAKARAENAKPPPGGTSAGCRWARRIDPDLAVLGLERVPADEAGFKRAYRETAMAAHPDRGGSTARMQAVNAAWDRIKAKYGA